MKVATSHSSPIAFKRGALMTSAQEQTVATYHQLMQINAMSHFLRAAREVGLLDQLRQRQHTLEELCDALSLQKDGTRLLADALVAMGVIERYGDDLALSRAAQLLCQYDQDFGDATWRGLTESLREGISPGAWSESQRYFEHQAATQWTHTPAAIQAAEVLDVGGDGQGGTRILDLGCGSAVWSLAMGHRDQQAQVTAIDHAGPIQAARSTAASIDMSDRFETLVGDPLEIELPSESFDLALLAQRISGLDDSTAVAWIHRAVAAIKPGGRVAIIDSFRGPGEADKGPVESTQEPSNEAAATDDRDAYARPSMPESVEALRVHVRTVGGRLRTLRQAQRLLIQAGLHQVQFAYLSASRLNLGIAVGFKRLE